MERWNRAMDAIEDNLDGSIDVPELARLALTSEYNFRRVFSALAGMSLSDYIRRRRLTVAAAAVFTGPNPAIVGFERNYPSDVDHLLAELNDQDRCLLVSKRECSCVIGQLHLAVRRFHCWIQVSQPPAPPERSSYGRLHHYRSRHSAPPARNARG